MATLIFFLIFAYLFGSISGGILVCKIMGLPDPRQQGSGNPGATNILRTSGKGLATLVLLIDGLKGLLPIVLARIFLSNSLALGFIGLVAIIGHMYPIFFKFKGGKGVATLIGVLLGINLTVAGFFITIWLIVVAIFRYSSLAALVATALMPFAVWGLVGDSYFFPLLLVALIIFYRHRTNIQRLLNKTESKIGEK